MFVLLLKFLGAVLSVQCNPICEILIIPVLFTEKLIGTKHHPKAQLLDKYSVKLFGLKDIKVETFNPVIEVLIYSLPLFPTSILKFKG